MELRLEKIGNLWPWVARITGTHHRWGLSRQFLLGDTDFSQATRTGSRGIYRIFNLTDGLYEISYAKSWSTSERYFARVEGDQLTRIELNEVMEYV